MADDATYVIQLAAWLGEALGGSAPVFADFSTETLGIDLPPAVLQSPAIAAALLQAQDAAKQVGDASTNLDTVAASDDELKILAAFIGFGVALAQFFVAVTNLVNAVKANITAATIPDPGELAAAQAFAGSLAKAIADAAMGSAIADPAPEFAFILRLAGLLDWKFLPAQPGQDLSTPYVRISLQLDRLKDLIKDPATHFRNTLGWGDPAFDPTDIFRLVSDFYRREDSVSVGLQGGEPALQIGSFVLRRDSTAVPPGLVLALTGELDADKTFSVPLNDNWEFGVTSSFRLTGSVSGEVTPPLSFRLLPATASITGEIQAFFDRIASARPFDILAGTGGLLTISANNISAGVGLTAEADTGGAVKINPLIFADLTGVTLKIGTSDSDSFIGSLLSGAQIQGQFDFGLQWQADTGLKVKASGGIQISIPIHKELGPIEFDVVYLALNILSDGTLSLEVSTALTGNLGPLTVDVDRIGALLNLRFAQGVDANFGPFDLGLGFKPPSGAGLAIDAGVVSGGGFLYFDPDKGEYAGVAQLSIADVITVTAIGLITTKMPDGSSGFSLLLILTTDFPPIQLGFGFTLNGVGGLLGLNRSAQLDTLRDGVRTGAIDDIMFPTDVIANAPRIISDLKAAFPPQENVFLVGPMAKFGWGDPSLITLSLGIIVEIPPGNIAILGVLRVALPTDDEALILIQVAFIGILDFDEQLLSFDASLYDSHVLFMTLEGDMAVRLNWGDNAAFILSVGGFHPAFHPPDGLHLPASMKRLSISILDYDWAKIKVDCYFAVTSNTVQFGAHLYLFFGVDGANITGQLGLDVLFQFSPFMFIAQISGSLSIAVFGMDLMSIGLNFQLSGPSPWEAKGTGSISILFFSIDVSFDVTWGEAKNTTLPPIDVMPVFLGEINKQSNWKALPPPSTNLLVSLRAVDPSLLVLHPFGSLTLTQRALPLNLTLDKVGNQIPDDVNRVDITQVSSAGAPLPVSDEDEQFAIAQFQNMGDNDKLSRPSYQELKGGVIIGDSDSMQSSKMTRRTISYDITIIDKEPQQPLPKGRYYSAISGLFHPFLAGSAAARSALSYQRKTQLQPFSDTIAVGQEGYAVSSTTDNSPVGAGASFSSEAVARDHMNSQIASGAASAGAVHVLPNSEVNAP
jgi:Family of unknown function (DUF6603)